MNHVLNGDPFRYPGLSMQYRLCPHGPFGVATSLVLSELCGSRRLPGQLLQSISTIFNGEQTLDGAEPAGYEIGPWKCRSMCDDEPDGNVPEDAYFAWVSPLFWDYDPPVVIYTRADFMTLFEDCCRNYVAALKISSPFNPEPIDRSKEFAEALSVNGMSLIPSVDRP